MRVYGVTGWKNAGKTGLMERLVAEITGRGYTVSTVKHAHHNMDVDQPGTDSYRHRIAGASEVLLASGQRVAIMQELRGAPEPLREKIFKNMSSRAAEMLKDDLEAAPPAKLSDVENSQKEILTVARRLSDAGEINLGGSGSEEFI